MSNSIQKGDIVHLYPKGWKVLLQFKEHLIRKLDRDKIVFIYDTENTKALVHRITFSYEGKNLDTIWLHRQEFYTVRQIYPDE